MMLNEFNYSELSTAIKQATKKAFEHLKVVTQHENSYVFGLYTCPECVYIMPTANTEEGLQEKAQEYYQNLRTENRSFDDYLESLRWNPCDWKYHGEGGEFFEKAQNLLDSAWSEDYSELYFKPYQVLQVYIEALAEFERTILSIENNKLLYL